MSAVIAWLAPWVVRAVSSEVGRRVAAAVVRYAFDAAEKALVANGQRAAAEILQAVEEQLIADPTPLVREVERALVGTPTVAARTR